MKVRTTGALAILALATLIACLFLVWPSAAVEVVYPVEHAKRMFHVRVWTRVKGFFTGAEARAENIRLRREVAALSLAREELSRVEEENARLRAALGYLEKAPIRWIAAGVLSQQGGAAGVHRILRVDRGTKDGVRLGAVVTVPDGLVGRVTGVTPHTAEVTLILSPSLRVACQLETGDAAPPHAILSGGSDEQLVMVLRHLQPASEILPRTRVVTSGLGGIYPRGLMIGTFVGRGRDDTLCVLPSVDYTTLEDVFIRRED